jgi:hypothetical protein
MQDLMFRYRSGAYFANIYAPDITLGMMTSEESMDIEPRQTSGRVITPEPVAMIENPYAEPELELVTPEVKSPLE